MALWRCYGRNIKMAKKRSISAVVAGIVVLGFVVNSVMFSGNRERGVIPLLALFLTAESVNPLVSCHNIPNGGSRGRGET